MCSWILKPPLEPPAKSASQPLCLDLTSPLSSRPLHPADSSLFPWLCSKGSLSKYIPTLNSFSIPWSCLMPLKFLVFAKTSTPSYWPEWARPSRLGLPSSLHHARSRFICIDLDNTSYTCSLLSRSFQHPSCPWVSHCDRYSSVTCSSHLFHRFHSWLPEELLTKCWSHHILYNKGLIPLV